MSRTGPSKPPPTTWADLDAIDPFAQRLRRYAAPDTRASSGARLASIAVDFLVIKAITLAVMVGIGSVALVVVLGGAVGEEDAAHTNTKIAMALGAVLALAYVVWLPLRGRGQTLGERVVGLVPRAADGSAAPPRTVVRHHLLSVGVPVLLLNPVAVLAARDLVVLCVWSLLQLVGRREGRTVCDRAAGVTLAPET